VPILDCVDKNIPEVGSSDSDNEIGDNQESDQKVAMGQILTLGLNGLPVCYCNTWPAGPHVSLDACLKKGEFT
jgi:hypothetical protein